MSDYVSDLWPGSPQESPAASGSDRSSRPSSRSRSRSSTRSSRSGPRRSSRSSSGGRGRRGRRSRSRSRSRRRHPRRYRRYSRSYSRSRSRSRGRRRWETRRAPPRRYFRSRSRSPGRPDFRGSRHAPARRRCYGFGRTGFPEERGRWRARSRSRTKSRSRSPLRLSEKDRMELLEIAKANAAKALGTTNFDLPASLRTVSLPKETSHGAAVAGDGAQFKLSEKLTEDGTKNSNEKSSQQRNTAVSANSSVAKPKENTANIAAEEKASGLPKIDKKKSPYGLWIPV
ncbi:PREDICTED: arginine/serine-rich protein 1 [Chinchilla lanigera]|uniref:arginine/serine-rich protein 1 n=1 Tax=Chinchilla lanigera TaxID=34839 RepID=UPI0006962A12|nr:PREDICTED: arginine/serine-rich protein 1 [Chinchilla lanigera]